MVEVISRGKLKTLFYVGRKLELVACYVPMATPQPRTVKAHRSYGYDMEKPDGKVSRLDFSPGQVVEAYVPEGTKDYTEVIISDPGPLRTVAAHYKLL